MFYRFSFYGVVTRVVHLISVGRRLRWKLTAIDRRIIISRSSNKNPIKKPMSTGSDRIVTLGGGKNNIRMLMQRSRGSPESKTQLPQWGLAASCCRFHPIWKCSSRPSNRIPTARCGSRFLFKNRAIIIDTVPESNAFSFRFYFLSTH